jgi:ABC-2 type transport system permease protein
MIWRPFLYDMRRTITSKTVLIIISFILLISLAIIPLLSLGSSIGASEASSIAALFFSGVFGVFMPLMAIIGSYSTYGKDRLTGVLESVLARPVTRLGLAISRFLSTVIAFALAVAAAVAVIDALVSIIAGAVLDQTYLVIIVGGLVVEAAAFTGLVFLLSHLLRSSGALLGISIVLFIVFDLFWGLIVFLVAILLSGGIGSTGEVQATIDLYFANPSQFITLINAYLQQSKSGSFLQSGVSLSLWAVVLDGILWTVVPFALFLYLAVKRD